MIFKVYLNDLSFRYEVYTVINIFYSLYNIEFVSEDNCDLYIYIADNHRLHIQKKNEKKTAYELNKDYKSKEEIKKAVFLYLSAVNRRIMPWGTLVGIRPSKIALKKIAEGRSEEEIVNYYNEHYCTKSDKAQLCIDIAKRERNFLSNDSKSISVYIDMPFCPTRCLYCSFDSNPINACRDIVGPYLEKLSFEIKSTAQYIKEKKLKIKCVYFGGGTPTSVNDMQFASILNDIYEYLVCGNDIKEFTVECGRPDSITEDKLISMKKCNVSRISINPQSMNDKTLKLIGRNHSASDIIEKFKLARSLGFDNINMDIIVGLPDEGIHEIERTCSEISKLEPDNITVHGLCVKRGSRLYENILKNYNYKNVNQNEINMMFEEAFKTAHDLFMKPYYVYRQKNIAGNMQNTGYSTEGKEGLYNMEMIEENQTIIGIGADAVTKVIFKDENRIERFPNVKNVEEYIRRTDEMIRKRTQLLNTLY